MLSALHATSSLPLDPFNPNAIISVLSGFLLEVVYQVPSYTVFIHRMHVKVESGSVITILAVTLCVSNIGIVVLDFLKV